MSLQTSLPKTIYAIQHLAFEDLGSLEDIFYDFGFRVRYFEAGVDDLTLAFNYEGLTIILGGPIGVYETEDYSFLKDELEGLKQRLLENKPTIGICLGAQLIAHALGAKVYAGHQKEIGWNELEIKLLDSDSNVLTSLESIKVLHWHGDTFDLPNNATLLASSTIYPNQAFSVGNKILALQFHLEMIEESFEKWLIGHTCEIRYAGLSIPQLREDNKLYAKKLVSKSREVIQTFLEKI
ncbi:glutamine amidotransferase [Acinetobacter beijerinckii]|uniref:glutamine amidotransferase n=1 Tax=Acinetobacter beijerinckii TaxID=262668 RepID=UPI002406F3F7|nr:glutamine amidotransferase [Acinetobacter beijerinckii]